jgi:hypothetical protein
MLQLQTTNTSRQQLLVCVLLSQVRVLTLRSVCLIGLRMKCRRLTIQSLVTVTRGYGPVYIQVEMYESFRYHVRVIDIKGATMLAALSRSRRKCRLQKKPVPNGAARQRTELMVLLWTGELMVGLFGLT